MSTYSSECLIHPNDPESQIVVEDLITFFTIDC